MLMYGGKHQDIVKQLYSKNKANNVTVSLIRYKNWYNNIDCQDPKMKQASFYTIEDSSHILELLWMTDVGWILRCGTPNKEGSL